MKRSCLREEKERGRGERRDRDRGKESESQSPSLRFFSFPSIPFRRDSSLSLSLCLSVSFSFLFPSSLVLRGFPRPPSINFSYFVFPSRSCALRSSAILPASPILSFSLSHSAEWHRRKTFRGKRYFLDNTRVRFCLHLFPPPLSFSLFLCLLSLSPSLFPSSFFSPGKPGNPHGSAK